MSVSPKYWLKYMDIDQDIGIDRPKKQLSVKMEISVSVSVADMLVQMYRYRQKYQLGEYISIS